MANPEHLKIPQKGVEVWNRWREENPGIQPDLRGEHLREMRFSEVNFSETNLSRTNLRHANLQGATLSKANLTKADLYEAILWGADFNGANCWGTDFSGADLDGVNLTGALLYETIIGNVDLTHVRGLDTCLHMGPCTIDHRTLMKSRRLPLSFLRGCGLPDIFIDHIPALFYDKPIQLYSVFISYSHQDEAFAQRLHNALQGKGVRCWYAPEDIQGGKKIHEQIDEAIRVYDKLLLVLSEHSMNSEWVKTEIANARRREVTQHRRMLFPIRLVNFETIRNWTCFDADTGKDSAREIREYFIPDFSNWKDYDSFERAFTRLLRDLKADDTQPSR